MARRKDGRPRSIDVQEELRKLPIFQDGDRVVVRETMLYNGRKGVVENPQKRDPEDFWDYNVRLNDGRLIGVYDFQIEKVA